MCETLECIEAGDQPRQQAVGGGVTGGFLEWKTWSRSKRGGWFNSRGSQTCRNECKFMLVTDCKAAMLTGRNLTQKQ